MKEKTLTEGDVVSLLTRDEDHFFDRKALMASGRAAQKIAVAFANSDGGEFVIGIADTESEPVAESAGMGLEKLRISTVTYKL